MKPTSEDSVSRCEASLVTVTVAVAAPTFNAAVTSGCAAHVHDNAALGVRLESRRGDSERISSRWKLGECEQALSGRFSCVTAACIRLCQIKGGSGNDCAVGVLDWCRLECLCPIGPRRGCRPPGRTSTTARPPDATVFAPFDLCGSLCVSFSAWFSGLHCVCGEACDGGGAAARRGQTSRDLASHPDG